MKERPILFNGEMVRAILEGRKTMTRRIVKLPIYSQWHHGTRRVWANPEKLPVGGAHHHDMPVCPYGVPGDRLWVKEATWIWCDAQPNGTTRAGRPAILYRPVGRHVVYCADSPEKPQHRIDDNPRHGWRFKPACFMPRWAMRLALDFVSVKVERLNDITEEGAKKEGCQDEVGWCSYCGGTGTRPYGDPCDCDGPGERIITTALERFEGLWDSINGKTPGASWRDNPWVWVIEFNRVKP